MQLRTALDDVAQGKARLLERAWAADSVDAYRDHIALEEREVYPFAEASLGRQQLAKLSAAMVARRTMTPR